MWPCLEGVREHVLLLINVYTGNNSEGQILTQLHPQGS